MLSLLLRNHLSIFELFMVKNLTEVYMLIGIYFEHFKHLIHFEIFDYFPMVGTYYLVSSHVINQ